MEHPAIVRRRIVPDETALQIILGSLLGNGHLEGAAGRRRMSFCEAAGRERYVWWKYERLAQLADLPPVSHDGVVSFSTIAHPLFDELAQLLDGSRDRVVPILNQLGRAVLRTDALATATSLHEPGPDEQPELIRE